MCPASHVSLVQASNSGVRCGEHFFGPLHHAMMLIWTKISENISLNVCNKELRQFKSKRGSKQVLESCSECVCVCVFLNKKKGAFQIVQLQPSLYTPNSTHYDITYELDFFFITKIIVFSQGICVTLVKQQQAARFHFQLYHVCQQNLKTKARTVHVYSESKTCFWHYAQNTAVLVIYMFVTWRLCFTVLKCLLPHNTEIWQVWVMIIAFRFIAFSQPRYVG